MRSIFFAAIIRGAALQVASLAGWPHFMIGWISRVAIIQWQWSNTNVTVLCKVNQTAADNNNSTHGQNWRPIQT